MIGRARVRQLAIDDMQVGAADAARVDLHQNLSRPGTRIGDAQAFERRVWSLEDHRLHRAIIPARRWRWSPRRCAATPARASRSPDRGSFRVVARLLDAIPQLGAIGGIGRVRLRRPASCFACANWRGVADATCVLSVLGARGLRGLRGVWFAQQPTLCAGGALLPAVADVLLSIDDIGGALASAFPAAGWAVRRTSPAIAHGAYDVEGQGWRMAVRSGVLPVVCAPTAPAAAIAVARRRIRGLNEDWFIATSNR